jgi:transketolase C-terminal domain/subunit
MADNTCHFGVNNFFADNGLGDVQSWLYFPADAAQMIAVVDRVFFEKGVRFVFSTRSKVPYLLKEDGSRFYDDSYKFVPGKDEIMVEGTAGYVVSYGEMVYRAWDAVLRLRKEGINVGLVNKPTLNLIDEEVTSKIGKSPFVLIVESQNQKTGVSTHSFVSSHAPSDSCLLYSSVLATARGFSSVASPPSTRTWAPSRRVAVVSPSRSPSRASTRPVRLYLLLSALR